MGTTIDDEFLILHILNNLPSEYDNVVVNLEERVDSAINPLGIEDVHQKLSEKFEKIKIRKKFKDDSDEEYGQALYTTKFKGCCNKCGKFGHKAKDCRLNPESNDNQDKKRKFTGKCHHCGKVGYKEVYYWLKHGKPKDKANTAKDRQEDDSDSDDKVVIISMEEREGYDFAGISFSNPDEKKVYEEDKNISEKVQEAKNEGHAEAEVLPDVTASMINWTQEMIEEFDRFTSHELESEDVEDSIMGNNQQEKISNDGRDSEEESKDINLMSKEKTPDEVESQIWIGDTGASCHMTNSMEGLINLKLINSKFIF